MAGSFVGELPLNRVDHVTTSSEPTRSPMVFVTGTDTGVGKTLLTGLLLHHLRRAGTRALAIKPFCSGGLADAELLNELQDRELRLAEVSPFQFGEPLAPMIAARIHGRRMVMKKVLAAIQSVRSKCDALLVEGVGGVLVPLGDDFSVLDLIAALDSCVLVVARNRLGTINHTLLSVNSLINAGVGRIKVVLMGTARRDASVTSNKDALSELLGLASRVYSVPFLGARASSVEGVKKNSKKIEKTLAEVLGFDTFSPLFGKAAKTMSEESR
ncbi:MAG TPA: dethiobiotin synthase [Candidatus Nitrosotalea sp.]|nr:dethiobiotin synthase [Candidatus Nitrosotalea sp.]